MPRHHRLKTLPDYFQAVWDGDKNFEVRRNDRGFQAGDRVTLLEHDRSAVLEIDPWPDGYSGRSISAFVTYVLAGGAFGIQAGHCVLGLNLADAVKVDND